MINLIIGNTHTHSVMICSLAELNTVVRMFFLPVKVLSGIYAHTASIKPIYFCKYEVNFPLATDTGLFATLTMIIISDQSLNGQLEPNTIYFNKWDFNTLQVFSPGRVKPAVLNLFVLLRQVVCQILAHY